MKWVKVPNKRGTSILTRSLQHLIPLEVLASECSSVDQSDSNVSEGLETADPDNKEISRNARRNAAVIGELKRRDNCY